LSAEANKGGQMANGETDTRIYVYLHLSSLKIWERGDYRGNYVKTFRY